MIAEHGETATRNNRTYLRLPTEEEAQKFYDSLDVTNKSLNGRTITFIFDTELEAKEFHNALIHKFGERK